MAKIVQITVAPGDAEEGDRLYALDAEGRVWILHAPNGKDWLWEEIERPATKDAPRP